MDQQVKDKLCKHIDSEIEKISNMPSLNDVTLANLYKLIDIKKDILEIDEKEMRLNMEDYQGGGNSFRGYRGNSSRMSGRYYDDGYSMNYSGNGGSSYDHMPEMPGEREMVRRQMMNNNIY